MIPNCLYTGTALVPSGVMNQMATSMPAVATICGMGKSGVR